MVRAARRQTDRYTAVYIEVNRALVDDEHRMILEAALCGQPTRPEALLTAQISSSYEQMLQYLASEGRMPGAGKTRVETRLETGGGT
jgi:DNA-binding GntR family transcriptional regulator